MPMSPQRNALLILGAGALVMLRGNSCGGPTSTTAQCESRSTQTQTIQMGLQPGYCGIVLNPCLGNTPEPFIDTDWGMTVDFESNPPYAMPKFDHDPTLMLSDAEYTDGAFVLCMSSAASASVGSVVEVRLTAKSVKSSAVEQLDLNVTVLGGSPYDGGPGDWSLTIASSDPNLYQGRFLPSQSVSFGASGAPSGSTVHWQVCTDTGGCLDTPPPGVELVPNGVSVAVSGPLGDYTLKAIATATGGATHSAERRFQITRGPIAVITLPPQQQLYYALTATVSGAASEYAAADGQSGTITYQWGVGSDREFCPGTSCTEPPWDWNASAHRSYLAGILYAKHYYLTLTVFAADDPTLRDTTTSTITVDGL
jgi:hypothetical protein